MSVADDNSLTGMPANTTTSTTTCIIATTTSTQSPGMQQHPDPYISYLLFGAHSAVTTVPVTKTPVLSIISVITDDDDEDDDDDDDDGGGGQRL